MASDRPTERPQPLLRIGAFAELAGTNLRTLRYYEELGLVRPTERSRGGFRYYRAADVHRLRRIRELQELGLPLERIRDLMAARADGAPADPIARVRAALEEQDRLLAERERSLAEQRAEVARALAKLRECEHCAHQPRPSNDFCEPCAVDGRPLPRDLSALF